MNQRLFPHQTSLQGNTKMRLKKKRSHQRITTRKCLTGEPLNPMKVRMSRLQVGFLAPISDSPCWIWLVDENGLGDPLSEREEIDNHSHGRTWTEAQPRCRTIPPRDADKWDPSSEEDVWINSEVTPRRPKPKKKGKKQSVTVHLVTPNRIMLTPKIQHTPREPSPLSDDLIRGLQHCDKISPSKLSQDTNRAFFASLVGLLEYFHPNRPQIEKLNTRIKQFARFDSVYPYVEKLQPFLKAENAKVSVVASSRRSPLTWETVLKIDQEDPNRPNLPFAN